MSHKFIDNIVLMDSASPIIGSLTTSKLNDGDFRFTMVNTTKSYVSHFTGQSLEVFNASIKIALKIINDSDGPEEIRINNLQISFNPLNHLKIINPLTKESIHNVHILNKEMGIGILKFFHERISIVLDTIERIKGGESFEDITLPILKDGKVKLIAQKIFSNPVLQPFTSTNNSREFFVLGYKKSRIYFRAINDNDIDFAKCIITLLREFKTKREDIIFHWNNQPELCRFVSIVKSKFKKSFINEQITWEIHLNSNSLGSPFNDKISISIKDEDIDYFIDELIFAISRNL